MYEYGNLLELRVHTLSTAQCIASEWNFMVMKYDDGVVW